MFWIFQTRSIDINVIVSLTSISDKEKFSNVWTTVVDTIDSFLFPKVQPPSDRSPEQRVEDEAVDCNIIEFMKDQVRMKCWHILKP